MMKPEPDPNFPRMMFHRRLEPVIVHSQAELDALGSEWAYRPFSGDEEPPAEPGQDVQVRHPAAKARPRKH